MQQLRKVQDAAHPTENQWDILLLMSIKFLAARAKRGEERRDDWKGRWEICKRSLTFPTSSNMNKTIQWRHLSLSNKKHFQLDSRFDESGRSQSVLIFKQLLCPFYLDGNGFPMAEIYRTAVWCWRQLHIPDMPPRPPASTAKCDGTVLPRGSRLGLRQCAASKKLHPPFSIS